MGSSFKIAIFDEHIQKGLVGWAKKAKQKTGFKRNANGHNQVGPKEEASHPPPAVQLTQVVKMDQDQDQEDAEGKKGNVAVGEIHPANGSK